MKLSAILIIVFICLFLASCTPKTEIPQQPTAQELVIQTPTSVVQTPTPTTPAAQPQTPIVQQPSPIPVTQPNATPTTPQRSKALQILLDKSVNIDNYEYSFTAPPYVQSQDMIYVKGNKMRIDLMQSYNTETLPYTTIFIDWKEETAQGYCLFKAPRCKKEYGISILDPAQFYHKTPKDWLVDVRKHAMSITTSKLVLGKKAQGTIFLLDKTEHTVYLDVFGMPVRVEIGYGGEKGSYNYNKLVINSVSDEKVNPPQIV